MEITKKTEYAIIALVELATHPGQYISAKSIASRQDIPGSFLPQIIAELSAKGWVIGVRGPGGGIRLEVDPGMITIKDVVELVEGPITISKCMSHKASCPRAGRCPLHPVWEEAQRAFLNVLEQKSIADLVR